MHHSDPKSVGGRYARGRKVRIVGQRSPSRAATWSLIGAAVAALIIPVFWRFGRSEEVVLPPAQGVLAMDMDWRCELGHVFPSVGHTFGADGKTASKFCPRCGEAAFPVVAFFCPHHGAVDVRLKFVRNEAGGVIPVAWSLSGKPWLDSADKLRCVQCKRVLQYRKDPLLSFTRRGTRGGG